MAIDPRNLDAWPAYRQARRALRLAGERRRAAEAELAAAQTDVRQAEAAMLAAERALRAEVDGTLEAVLDGEP